MAAAAIIFFAFYGFDAIATAAEETRRPERDLAIGIVGAMVICTAIYVLVALSAVGALSYTRFADSPEPLALILRQLGQGRVAYLTALAAVISLPTVILGFLYGQSRIFLVMARDGFLPRGLARSVGAGTPARITAVTAVFVSILAAFLPIDQIAALANAGTLIAFARWRSARWCCVGANRAAPSVPRAACRSGWAGGGSGLRLPVHQPAPRDAVVVAGLECAGSGALHRVWPPQGLVGIGMSGRGWASRWPVLAGRADRLPPDVPGKSSPVVHPSG
jgi:hypothetical protein